MVAPAAVLREVSREIIACPACRAPRFTPYIDGRGYAVVRCQECGLIYVNPQPSPSELEEYYAGYDLADQWVNGEEPFNRGVRDVVLRFKKSGRALDVGCGPGQFLRCLREAGFRVFGVEPSEAGSKYARTVNGIETFQGTVEAFLANTPSTEFDVVSALNVIEHVKDPAKVLQHLWTMVSEDGVLVVGVPDARLHVLVGEVRRSLGFRDPFFLDTVRHPLVGIDPPHHLTSFEPRTICKLLVRCGFAPVYVRNAPIMFNADRWKNVAKRILYGISETLYWMSFRRLVLGYSTLVVAIKRRPAKDIGA